MREEILKPLATKIFDLKSRVDKVETTANKEKTNFNNAIKTHRDETKSEITSLENKIKEIDDEMQILQSDLRNAGKTSQPIKIDIYKIVQNPKFNNLVIAGLPEQDTENLATEITKLAKSLDATISPNFQAERLGKEKSHPRPILVEFANQWDRRKLFAARLKLANNKDVAKVFINEDLNKYQAGIFFLARQAKKFKLIQKTWTFGGVVRVTLLGAKSPTEVDSEETLRKLVPQLPQFAKRS